MSMPSFAGYTLLQDREDLNSFETGIKHDLV